MTVILPVVKLYVVCCIKQEINILGSNWTVVFWCSSHTTHLEVGNFLLLSLFPKYRIALFSIFFYLVVCVVETLQSCICAGWDPNSSCGVEVNNSVLLFLLALRQVWLAFAWFVVHFASEDICLKLSFSQLYFIAPLGCFLDPSGLVNWNWNPNDEHINCYRGCSFVPCCSWIIFIASSMLLYESVPFHYQFSLNKFSSVLTSIKSSADRFLVDPELLYINQWTLSGPF